MHVHRLAGQFEAHRPRLCGLAYRMLGSWSDAEDAVQDAWLRLVEADAKERVENPGGWLHRVVSRLCLDRLRERKRVESPEEIPFPDPLVTPADPEEPLLQADAIGLAFQIALETLSPSERVAFLLHDVFGTPFGEIAGILDRSPEAVRQLASRARRRIRSLAPTSDLELPRQYEAVEAFFAAVRGGDLKALLELLHPEVELRSQGGPDRPHATLSLRGADEVARRLLALEDRADAMRPVLVDGGPGALLLKDGRPVTLIAFVVTREGIVRIDALADASQPLLARRSTPRAPSRRWRKSSFASRRKASCTASIRLMSCRFSVSFMFTPAPRFARSRT